MCQDTSRVCIVDDDPSVRRALTRLFRSDGRAVEAFSSALEFLASPTGITSGCIVLDVRMQGMTGLDLQRELMARGSAPAVVFITAHEDQDAHRQAMENGAIAYLIKPVDDRDLLDAVAAAVTAAERRTP